MVMNLMGVPTDVPLYDCNGNPIQYDPHDDSLMNFEYCYEFEDRESTEEDKRQSDSLLSIVRKELESIDLTGSDLRLSDLVNVYEYNIEGADSGEYYTVTVFGGKNGTGAWSDYLKSLSELVSRLESQFNDVWVRKWNIDVTDDVFDVEIAILI